MMMKKIISLGLGFLLMGLAAPVAAKTYDKDYFGEMETLRAKYEDTLVHISRRNNLGFVEILTANPGLDPWIPGEGAEVILPKKFILPDAPRSGIVINLPEMRLYYFPKGGAEPRSYAIGVGREGLKTPMGTTKVARKAEGPIWRPTDRMRKEDPTLKVEYGPGPDNPMGTHAMYLGWPQYAIHGTNKPYGIGRRSSSGCIRMYPEGIVDLYDDIPVGTQVTVVDQPVKVGWIGDRMYIEVHPTQDQTIEVERLQDVSGYEMTAADMKRIYAKAGAFEKQIDWENVNEAVRHRSGYPVAVLDKTLKPGERVKDEYLEKLRASEERLASAGAVQNKKNEPTVMREDGTYVETSASAAPEKPKKADVVKSQKKTEANASQGDKTEAELFGPNAPRASNPRTIQTWNN